MNLFHLYLISWVKSFLKINYRLSNWCIGEGISIDIIKCLDVEKDPPSLHGRELGCKSITEESLNTLSYTILPKELLPFYLLAWVFHKDILEYSHSHWLLRNLFALVTQHLQQ